MTAFMLSTKNEAKQQENIQHAAKQWFNIVLMDIRSKQTIAVVQTEKRQDNFNSKRFSLKV